MAITGQPYGFAQKPDHARDREPVELTMPLDPVSSFLDMVRLRGSRLHRTQATTGEQINWPPNAVHLMERGEVTIEVAGERSVRLAADDHALTLGGDAHRIVAEADSAWLTGTFAINAMPGPASHDVLPRLIVMRGGAAGEWLTAARRFILEETRTPLPGANIMIGRLLDVILIRSLRHWVSEAGDAPGWLQTAMDPKIGRTLAAIHTGPEQLWTIDRLSTIAGMSRSAFKQRFHQLMGTSPISYVAGWRLDRALQMLRDGNGSVSDIALASGYTSISAFSRAFRKRHGFAPSRSR